MNDEIRQGDIQGAVQPEAESAARPRSKVWKEIREWAIALAAAVLIALLIRTFLFTLIRVDGNSMMNTLLNNERLFVSVLDVKIAGVDRGDVVICHYPNRYSAGLLGIRSETNFVKRVWGAPGDVVERKNGVTYVNGEPIDELRGALYPNGKPDDYAPYTLGADEYFVVGDNIYDSHDSRDWNDRQPDGDVGPITGDMIIGRARFVIWPLDRLRAIE
ncbi:MAG: signal peptidase I [Clostridiales bacterium]|nr:signal peptidase I [Clostridiales bacterium]